MHQSFVVPASAGPGNSEAFNFLVCKALLKAMLNALHCEAKCIVKSLLKVPAPRGVNINEQQMNWTI